MSFSSSYRIISSFALPHIQQSSLPCSFRFTQRHLLPSFQRTWLLYLPQVQVRQDQASPLSLLPSLAAKILCASSLFNSPQLPQGFISSLTHSSSLQLSLLCCQSHRFALQLVCCSLAISVPFRPRSSVLIQCKTTLPSFIGARSTDASMEQSDQHGRILVGN